MNPRAFAQFLLRRFVLAFHDDLKEVREQSDPIAWLEKNLVVDSTPGPELLRICLTGERPDELALIVKAVVETEAPLMSTVATGSVARELRGDLDTIVAKALRKRPGERYVSVTAFAEDLTRYLQHLPISARPETIGYRTAKFVRRNVVTVAAAAITLAALSAGLFVANRLEDSL
jgi:hypothetical protein